MTDAVDVPIVAVDIPVKLCEKCRHEFPVEQFVEDLDGLECVCRRCLLVMGYALKGGR